MLDALSFVTDWRQYFWYLVLIIASAITTWRIKVRFKREMEHGLKRKVDDSELVSINRWMDLYDVGDRRAAERVKNNAIE